MNMLATITPKSDQTNSDDFIGGPRTVTITRVTIDTASEQPASFYYGGDNGKPYKPCKTMRRAIVKLWGDEASAYVGRSMTLYRDDTVQFGKEAVGGIRISHVSDIDREVIMPLTQARGRSKLFTFRPIKNAPPAAQNRPAAISSSKDEFADEAPTPTLEDRSASLISAIGRCETQNALDTLWEKKAKALRDELENKRPDDLFPAVREARMERARMIAGADQ